jgi:hypothetical protein
MLRVHPRISSNDTIAPKILSLDKCIALLSFDVLVRKNSLAFPMKLCGVARSEFEAIKETQGDEDRDTKSTPERKRTMVK